MLIQAPADNGSTLKSAPLTTAAMNGACTLEIEDVAIA
jgi:hypothetical protein